MPLLLFPLDEVLTVSRKMASRPRACHEIQQEALSSGKTPLGPGNETGPRGRLSEAHVFFPGCPARAEVEDVFTRVTLASGCFHGWHIRLRVG